MSNKNSLTNLVKSRAPNGSLLEVGVAQGDSAVRLLEAFPELSYTGLDEWYRRPDMKHEANKLKNWSTQEHWDGIYAKVLRRLEPFGERAKVIRANSHVALPTITEKFDIILVDGDHSYQGALDDLHACVPLLAEGGAMWVDDVDYIKDVRRALDKFLAENKDFKKQSGCILVRK